jgi:hypothetical protein
VSRPVRDLLLGLALTLVACACLLWYVDASGALRPAEPAAKQQQQDVDLFKLYCPLH